MILKCRRYSRSFERFIATGGQIFAGLAEGRSSAGGDRGVRTVLVDEQQVSRSAGQEVRRRERCKEIHVLLMSDYNAHFFFTLLFPPSDTLHAFIQLP